MPQPEQPNEWLAEMYNTNGAGDAAAEQLEKQAQVDFFAKLAADQNIDLSQMSPDEIEEMYQFTYSQKGEGEVKEAAEEEDKDKDNGKAPSFKKKDKKDDEEDEEEILSTEAGDAACLTECVDVCLDDCDEDDGACTRECESDCADRCLVGAPVQEDDGSDEEVGGEVWSCPDTRPELW